MSLSTIKTPGVYINEVNAFPTSIVPVATAVPAFIGYTPHAVRQGRSYVNTAIKITSFADFEAIYCLPSQPLPAPPVKQYNPQYYLIALQSKPNNKNHLLIDGTYYTLAPDPNSIYYLYNSVRMFYQNGGTEAYIVSVGTYGPLSGRPLAHGQPLINPNVRLNDLLTGLSQLQDENEPTMYICPEATLLSLPDNATLTQAMLSQNEKMGTAISVFDIIGGNDLDTLSFEKNIANFRNGTGYQGLCYGTAYYPFIETSIIQAEDIDYTNLFGGDTKQLAEIINSEAISNQTTTEVLNNIQSETSALAVRQLNDTLMNVNPAYKNIIDNVLANVNIMPASGAMAGLMTKTDQATGVWTAPLNFPIVGVSSLPVDLSASQEANLYTDEASGKSINAIRSFKGLGILVAGARTLDGNSNNWRYLTVRRTMIMIEQSIKLAAKAYVFEPNNQNTWEAVKAMISDFLITVWKQGGLMGASASDAYSVACGLGSTMTADDILNGYLIISIKLALVKPAEFIEITFRQQMLG